VVGGFERRRRAAGHQGGVGLYSICLARSSITRLESAHPASKIAAQMMRFILSLRFGVVRVLVSCPPASLEADARSSSRSATILPLATAS
jgi:hypothetical protein